MSLTIRHPIINIYRSYSYSTLVLSVYFFLIATFSFASDNSHPVVRLNYLPEVQQTLHTENTSGSFEQTRTRFLRDIKSKL